MLDPEIALQLDRLIRAMTSLQTARGASAGGMGDAAGLAGTLGGASIPNTAFSSQSTINTEILDLLQQAKSMLAATPGQGIDPVYMSTGAPASDRVTAPLGRTTEGLASLREAIESLDLSSQSKANMVDGAQQGLATLKQAARDSGGDESSDRAIDAGAQMAGGAIKTVVGVFTGNLALAANGLYDFAKGVANGVQALEDMASNLLASRQHLMAFNGTMAAAHLEMERRSILRNVRSGAQVADADKSLSEAYSDFQDEMQPLRDTMHNIQATLTTGLLRMATAGLSTLNDMREALFSIDKENKDRKREAGPDLPPFIAFMKDLRDGKLKDKQNQFPPRK